MVITMDKLKTSKILKSLDKKVFEIFNEVNTFMEDILGWANELEEMVEKEYSSKNDEFAFQLPKTPSERKLRNKANKTTVVPSMDSTMTTRTRAGRRVLTSQMSRLNITTASKAGDTLDAKLEPEDLEKTNNVTLSHQNETFVMHKTTSLRSKPVVKKQQKQETTELSMNSTVDTNCTIAAGVPIEINPEPSNDIKASTQIQCSSPDQRRTQSSISRTVSETPVGRQSQSNFSRTNSHSSARQSSNRTYGVDIPDSDVAGMNALCSPELSSTRVVGGSIRKKISRALSESPIQRPSKFSKTFSKEAESEYHTRNSNHRVGQGHEPPCRTFKVSRTPTRSPVVKGAAITSSEENSPSSSPMFSDSKFSNTRRSSFRGDKRTELLVNDESIVDKTVTVNHQIAATFVVEEMETELSRIEMDDEKAPRISGSERLTKIRKTSTPVPDKLKTFSVVEEKNAEMVAVKAEKVSCEPENRSESFHSAHNGSIKDPKEEEEALPKRKNRTKKQKLSEETVSEVPETGRMTRTKSKAIKEKMQEAMLAQQQQDLSEFAKKLLNKAKQSSQKKNQLAALVENHCTPTKTGAPILGIPGGLLTSKNKYHGLLSSLKKQKTPLATLSNSSVKKPQPMLKRDQSEKKTKEIRSAAKVRELESENKLQTKKNKEDEAAKKRQQVIQNKKEELKKKNELKHQLAMKQREKLEQEKYQNMVQSEKEKEEKHRIILQERAMKVKEEAFKKKMMTQQKIAETMERRRQEEEARIAKLKEMEAEEQRIALEKQKEQERQEKREQERLALKKAREEYELQVKRELEAERLKAEKAAKKGIEILGSTSKMQSACKKQRFGVVGDKREWDYKARNENDYGLEDEHSQVESDDEKDYNASKPVPAWASKVMNKTCAMLNTITLDILNEYMSCYQKTPDIHKMFNMTPTKRIKRTSSAIWNTPTS